MNDDLIADDVKQFILQYIESVAQLEGLLMLRAEPQKLWQVDAVAGRLYITDAQARILLAHLADQGFIAAVGNKAPIHYQYKPQTPVMEDMTARVAELYRQYLVPITNLIHSKPKTRIQEFANAFRIRKD